MALNLEELGKIVREMQAQSTANYKRANNFNEVGAAIVQLGVDDKMRSKGWPVRCEVSKTLLDRNAGQTQL